MSHQTWLEAPYQAAEEAGEAFLDWCENNDLDPNETEFSEFEEAMEDAEEDAYLRAAEARAEAREADWNERW